MALLLMLALLPDRIAIVLQRVAGMLMLLFKGANLFILVQQAGIQVRVGLSQSGVFTSHGE